MKKLSTSVLAVVLSSSFIVANAQQAKKDSVKTTKIDELVMVAYGTQKKSEIAGSITTIKAKDLEQAQTTNAVQSLTGKVGGVQISTTNGQPGSEPQVRFRGIGSLSSSNEPLYVVDGVPFNGTINSISNQDIESVTFLKDAAANALYGSRGANGVVVITTKKGKGRKLSVTFDTKVGINSRAIPEYDIITNPGEFYEAYYERLKADYRYNNVTATDADASAYAIANLITGDKGLVYNVYNVANNQLIDPTTGKIRTGAGLLYSDNWQKAIFKNRIRQEHNLSISGGSDKLDAYFSLGYLNDEGYVINSGFDRYTARLNTNFKISKNLETGVNINYSKTLQDSPLAGVGSGTYSNVISFARNIAPIYPIYARNANGSIAYDPKTGNAIFDWGRANGYMGLERSPYSSGQNAYAQALLNQRKNTQDNISGRAYLSYSFLNGFNFRYNLGYDLVSGNYLRYGTAEGGDAIGSGGSITSTFDKQATITNQQLLSWDKKFGNHNISVMVGHETSDLTSEVLSGNKTNVVIPNLAQISNASRFGSLNGYADKYKVEGFLSRINYSYANKYFFNASFRRDGSSVFSPNMRWGNFYGLGGAWAVSNEKFLKGNNIITNLRLKAGYGEQGNDNIIYPGYVTINHRGFYRNYAPYKNQYEVVPDASGNSTIIQVYEGNKNLKWEVSKNFNAGLELSLFDRITIDAQVFERAVSDMIYNRPLPLSTGTAFISENIGDMRNRGIETAISIDVIKNTDLNWNIFGNATLYKNKVTRIPSQFNSEIFMFKEGISAYTYYMREFAGVDKTNGDALWYKDVKDASGNVTGKTTTNDYNSATLYVLNKNANPKVYGGFGTSLQYKNWTLGANFSYQFGGYLYDGVYAGLLSPRGNDRGSNFHRDIHKTWTHNNTNASLPAIDFTRNNANATSTLFLTKSDYISLEDVSLSYDINPDLISEYGISGLKLGVYATNVALWSARKGLDPRMMNLGASSTNGQTLNRYGATRTVSLGLTVKF